MSTSSTMSTSKMEFAERPVRQQLLLAFGGTVGAFFVLLVGLCAAIIFSLSELVIIESRSALTEQIVQNSQLLLGDVGMTLDAIIAQGAAALVLPLAVAVFDTNDKEITHSLLAPDLYSDNNVNLLAKPLVTSTRYLCETTDPDLDPQRGCDGTLQQISESASSSYIPGFLLDGSNVPARMAEYEAISCNSNPGLADLSTGRSLRFADALTPRTALIRRPTRRRRPRSTCSLPRRGRTRFTGWTSSSAAKIKPIASGPAPSARSRPMPTACARTTPPPARGSPRRSWPTEGWTTSHLASAGKPFWRSPRLCSRSRMSMPSGADTCSRSPPPSSHRKARQHQKWWESREPTYSSKT